MMSISFHEEQRQRRLARATVVIEIAADRDDAARYDLPPYGFGLELQSQILTALAASSFLAGAEISVKPQRPGVVQ